MAVSWNHGYAHVSLMDQNEFELISCLFIHAWQLEELKNSHAEGTSKQMIEEGVSKEDT